MKSQNEPTLLAKSFLIRVITTILKYPSLFIMIPSLVMFTLSFDVLYDFTIKQFNSHLATQFGVLENTYKLANTCDFSKIDRRTALTKVIISHDNVLDYTFLQQVKQFQESIDSTCIISLTDFVPLDNPNHFRNALVRYVNYDLNILTTFLFLNKLGKTNHIIDSARSLNVFILHKSPLHLNNTELTLSSSMTFNDTSSIFAFIDYFLVHNNLYSYTHYFFTFSDLIFYGIVSGFLLFMFLSIANNHNIRSNVGLLAGWIINVFISTVAAININTFIHRCQTWNLVMEPSTRFTRLQVFFIVAMFTSRVLFHSIDILTDSKESDLHKRLYRYYSGLKGLPMVAKTFVSNIIALISVVLLGTGVLYCCFQGYLLQSILSKLFNFSQICLLALVFEYVMELTFIVGIIIVDLKKVSLTDVIEDSNSTNALSTMLLKLKYPSHARPYEDSLRYKLGQLFLRTKFTKTTELILYGIGILQLLGVFIHWSLIIPKKDDAIIELHSLEIIYNSNTAIYFLEYILIVIFILAIAGIIFRFNPPSSPKATSSLSTEDFIPDEKHFNSISLQNGHSLDVVKIKTNPRCSFVVTIGLDHKILIWSPLSSTSKPTDISSKVNDKEFWPINHVSISEDGDYTVLINFKFGIIKCFNRTDMSFAWMHQNNDFLGQRDKHPKILESFFRKKTVPGFLARKMLSNRTPSRRGSDASINGNYPPPPISMKSFGERQREIAREMTPPVPDSQLIKDEFVIILETGELIVYSCTDGKIKSSNMITSIYGTETDLKILSAKKIRTPRINDRIVCQMSNSDLIVATVINNSWKFRKLAIKQGQYNQENKFIRPSSTAIAPSTSANDFTSMYKEKPQATPPEIKGLKLNVSCIVPLEFLGMIVVVKNLICELIDIQTGIVLKQFHIANFKPNSFRVTHSEPTHCKFCGCASIQALSIVYEDYDSSTIITQTYKIDEQRSKSNICLRVERDPREIRCLGFNAVSEHQYWFRNVVSWEMTDVNMIIGIIKKDKVDNDEEGDESEKMVTNVKSGDKFDQLVENRCLTSLRNRRKHGKSSESKSLNDIYEGFIVTVSDGKRSYYQLPTIEGEKHRDFSHERINAIERYGFKSIICNFGNLLEIYYLGNDKLIEQDIYYNPDVWSQDNKSTLNRTLDSTNRPPQNSELLFINKRRTMGRRK